MNNKYRYNKRGISVGAYKSILQFDKNDYEFFLKLPQPVSDREFALLSKVVFGKELTLKEFRISVSLDSQEPVKLQVEINEPYDSYDDAAFNQYIHDSDYEVSSAFMRSVFGELTCGGIAGTAYGQFRVKDATKATELARWASCRKAPARKEFVSKVNALKKLIADTCAQTAMQYTDRELLIMTAACNFGRKIQPDEDCYTPATIKKMLLQACEDALTK